jgi:hypothetical protein
LIIIIAEAAALFSVKFVFNIEQKLLFKKLTCFLKVGCEDQFIVIDLSK